MIRAFGVALLFFGQCLANDSLHKKREGIITVFGSSVANGRVASPGNGYWERLRDKMAPLGFEVIGRSIGGDTTARLLARFDDLLETNPDFGIIGLSLANEGIFNDRDVAYASFEQGMETLVSQVRENGIQPVIALCYSNNEYTAEDYEYIKRMNLLLNSWDVPSFNLLGALDDTNGAGHWTDGYWGDDWHPNDPGHEELFLSIVPSLFSALQSGKPKPTFQTSQNDGITVKENRNAPISTQLLDETHSFTMGIQFLTSSSNGILGGFSRSGILPATYLELVNGALRYNSPPNFPVVSAQINEGEWHQLIISHSWAAQRTIIYLDGSVVTEVNERMEPSAFYIGGPFTALGGNRTSPEAVTYRDFLLYRSAINDHEANALYTGEEFVQASLEVYAPLSVANLGQNMAQSMTEIKLN